MILTEKRVILQVGIGSVARLDIQKVMDKTFKKYIGTGCTALVTGASSGMGLEYARQLAASGCGVVMVSNQQQELEQCAVELRAAYSARIWPIYCDLARNESADELFAICQEKGLQIDILINNAGMFFFKELKDEVCEVGDKMLFLHVITPTRLCERFAEGMKQRAGVIF